MATHGQFWTEAQRVATEDKAFWLERIALFYTIVVGLWLEKQCSQIGDNFYLLNSGHWLFPLFFVFFVTTTFYFAKFINNMAEADSLLDPIQVQWGGRIHFWLERFLLFLSFVKVPVKSIVFYLSLMLFCVSFCACAMYLTCFLDRISFLRWFICGDDDDHDSGKKIGISKEEEVALCSSGERCEGDDDDHDNGKNVGISEEEEEVAECSSEESCKDDDDNVNDNDHHDNDKNVEDAECTSNIKREHCGQCEESCEAMLDNWEPKFKKLHNGWLRKMNDTKIETEKELQRAEDAHLEDRRKWEEEKVQLVGKLSAAIASAELYRNLLHDNVRLFLEE